MPGPTDVDDIWMMIDRVARARYESNGTLDSLEHDIRYEVLRGGTWSKQDLDCKRELDRLEKERVIRKLDSFWAISPFPSVCRARQSGELVIDSKRFPFDKGQDLVWACPMTRDRFNLDEPILIGDFDSDSIQRLCSEMKNAMMGNLKPMED